MSTTRRDLIITGAACAGAFLAGAGVVSLLRRPAPAPSAPPPPAAAGPSPWREAGAWTLPLARVRDLAAAGPAAAVGGDRAVLWLDGAGAVAARCELPAEPLRLAVDAAGAVWAAAVGGIWRCEPGAARRVCELPAACLPTGLAVADGAMWVADAAARRLRRISADGVVQEELGGPAGGDHVPGFVVPSPWFAVAAAADGTVWAANPGRHRLERWSPAGGRLEAWGRPGGDDGGFCGCCNPAMFRLLPDGRFLTAEKGRPRVKLHAADGGLIEVVAHPDAFHPDTTGLAPALDAAGRVLVLDPHRRAVRVFARGA